ncbi:helix-turn-helix domain-containing protein [Stenotrophomonas maltophilia]|uniref:helix-turn-helix domain-containing protein n=1 Tax=Stenotrophomonas maltophilia TaxID=40324 RepID=UPI002ACCF1C8|nr:helix-turn-helix domain-containing protein [Stenotrophomonas maltophilia]MDZ5781602.1 helix-turn-helix domain-containing protein [Stenotrophomonas maltophilia]
MSDQPSGRPKPLIPPLPTVPNRGVGAPSASLGVGLVGFPPPPPAPPLPLPKTSSTELIWGKKVYSHGYAAVPSILLQSQAKLGLNNTQLAICIQLLDYWHDPSRKPFPSKKDLAQRMGVTEKTVQTNIKALEKKGLILRETRKSSAGDWASNIYHLDGLVKTIQSLEPEFAAEKIRRKEAQARLRSP